MATCIIVVLAVYFIVMIGIGLMGRKHATNFSDYLSAGHSSGIILVAAATAGMDIGNGLVVGGAAEGSTVGFSGIAYGVGCALGVVVCVIILNDFVYKNGYAYLSEYLRERYTGDALPIIYNIVTLMALFGTVGAQLMAGKAVFEAYNIDGRIGVIAIAVCVLLYSHISGLWGSYATSAMQTLIIVIALISVTIIIIKNGGIAVIQDAVNSGELDKSFVSATRGYSCSTWVAYVVPTMLGIMTSSLIFMRIESAKDAKTAKIGQLVGAVLILIAAMIPVFIGMYGRAKYGIEGNAAFIKVVSITMPPIIVAIIVVAIIAAVMSTVDANYILMSRILLKEIYMEHINDGVSEKTLSRLTLLCNILVTVVGVLLALEATSIVSLLSKLYVLGTSSILVPFLGGRIWKKGTKEGAVASSVIGIIASLLQLSGIINLPFYAITLVIPGLVVYVVVSIATGKK